MIQRQALEQYLDQFLNCKAFQDYCPNGLQIEGRESIHRICTAVSACKEVIEIANDLNADALLVHHGLFWKGEPAELLGMKRLRVQAVLKQDLNLFAYHLPLDCHPQIGNNAAIADLLDITELERHAIGPINDLLWSGKLDKAYSPQDLQNRLSTTFQRQAEHIHGGRTRIETIAWCTGAAQDYLEQAARLGADAFISGELSERTYYQAKELGIDYFACGHHATERYGIQRLGQQLATQFELEHRYIEIDNPL